MTLKLYYSPGACSLAPHIVLHEAGASYEGCPVPIREGAHLRPDYLAINRKGRVPALAVDGTIVTENVAILNYLGRRFPDSGVLPIDDLMLFARCNELLSFYAASVHVAFGQYWRMERFAGDEGLHPAIKEAGRRAILEYYDEIETLAAAGDWFVGERFTVADTYPLVFYRWGGLIGVDMSAYPHWSAHTERMLRRPAVARTLAAEGLEAAAFRPRG